MKKILMLLLILLATLTMFAKTNKTPLALSPVDTVDVVCYDLELNSDLIGLFGMTYIFADNKEYKLTGCIFADSIPPGTYTDCLIDLNHRATGTMIPSKDKGVSLTLSVDENRHCVIHGTMIGEDNVLYNLDLSWQAPIPTDTVNISFPNSAWVAYYPDLYHDFTLGNQSDEYYIALDILGVPMGGTFTEQNLFANYCVIANKVTGDTVKIADAEGRVWQSHDTTYMTAKVIGFDAVCYNIDFWYAVPTVTETVTLNIHNATFYNELEKEGYYAVVGMTDDKSTEFAISILADTEEEIPGTYINDGLFGGFSGKNYDFVTFISGQYATYIAKWNEDKQDYDIVTIEKGEAKVTMDDNEDINITGWFIGVDGVKYQITMTSKVDKPRLTDDAQSGAVDRILTGTDTVTITDNSADNGPIKFEMMTDSELLALWFYAEKPDADIIIPEGTYYIDDSGDFGSVVAGDGSLGKSFYSTHDGVYFTSLYFLVSGTVEVTKNAAGKLHFELNAVNSYDIPVHIIYDAGATTGISNSPLPVTNPQKCLINGQLLILHNGDTYNVVGARVK